MALRLALMIEGQEGLTWERWRRVARTARMFGIPFPPVRERVDRLECGARAIRVLREGKKVTPPQPYYPLVDAESHPVPPGGRVPLIIGARGERRPLAIAAAHADAREVRPACR